MTAFVEADGPLIGSDFYYAPGFDKAAIQLAGQFGVVRQLGVEVEPVGIRPGGGVPEIDEAQHFAVLLSTQEVGVGITQTAAVWMYNVATGKFELKKVQGPVPITGKADLLVYIPSIQKLFFWHGGAKDAWLYDPRANAWSKIAPTGPLPPFGIDANVCLDLKRERIYFGGGYYPLASGPNAFWCYDIKANAWVDLQPQGQVCGGCHRFGPNHAVMHYDTVNDVVVLFYHRLPGAPPDGSFNPGPKALGIYVYDPTTNTWSKKPEPLPKEIGQCPNGFYSPDLKAHFIHCAGDSEANGVMTVYRYKKSKG